MSDKTGKERERRSERKEGEGERRRRRREEGGEENNGEKPKEEEKRRRRRDEGGEVKPEGERRRRRDEAAKKEEEKRASVVAAAAEKPEEKPADQKKEEPKKEPKEPPAANPQAPEKRVSSAKDAPTNELNLTYTAFSRQRRALDKYEKKCSYDQLLDKLHTDQFLEIMGGKFQDRDHAKREKERCKTTETMAKKAMATSSSAGIMADFYTTLLTWGGVPVPGNVREIVDGMEKRYRAERKAEKERKEEEERRAAEAKTAEVIEEIAPEEEDDAYADDFENEEEAFDPNQAYINAQINLQMQAEYQQAQKSKKERDKVGSKRVQTPTKQNQGILLPEQKGLSHAEILSQNKKQTDFDRQLKRSQEILQLVPLDSVTYDMIEIQPITEYDLYIRNFGQSNSEQVSTQVPDETEIEATAIQTDEITMGSYAAQAPEDLGLHGHEGDKRVNKRLHVDTAKLSAFVTNCAGVFRVLLDESNTGLDGRCGTETFCFSSRATSLSTLKYATKRGATGVSFSRTSLQYIVTIHGKSDPEDTDTPCHQYDGLCIVWNINNPTTPDKICVANGAIASATFSPHNSFLLYAGSHNGSVYLWDLREPDFMHSLPNQRKDAGAEILRTPTYTTDHLSTDNHCCAVRRILPVGYNSILIGGKDTDASEQVASLDEMGNVNIWIVVDVQDKRAFEKDYGLNVGGKVRLFRSATVTANPLKAAVKDLTQPPSGAKVGTLQDLDPSNVKESISPMMRRRKQSTAGVAGALWEDGLLFPEVCAHDLEFQPDDASQFLIASDNGYIIHSSRFGDGAVPSRYRSTQPVPTTQSEELSEFMGYADTKHGTHVLTLHYSTKDNRMFLAGFQDGTIGVYKTGRVNPLFTLDSFTSYPVIAAKWCMIHKGVIWALDSNGYLYLFDLVEDEPTKRNVPVFSQNCQIKSPSGGVSFPNDFDFSYDDREPKIAISYSCGRVNLHVPQENLLSGRSPASNGDWLDSLL
eukprot:TRINITY_DN3294_c1_g1_i1.p1 TRINITY_DN3294_c1_g1~~TRINITY_DN3294_c1_g1_i1.p1  ORF type:complete len:981 (+),score=271.88 TRINITY_DN3294_c1_g1_i1:39-2981(+)